jgi:hypothetical protein
VASIATHNPPEGRRATLSVFVLATTVLGGAIGSAFAFGWVFGRMLL